MCDHEAELERAYRTIQAFHHAHTKGELLNPSALSYHLLTIAAARRFVLHDHLDGSTYFIGKPLAVLHEAMQDQPTLPGL